VRLCAGSAVTSTPSTKARFGMRRASLATSRQQPAALREAFALVEDTGERFWLADLHRLSGHVLLNGTIKAMEIARSQEARLLELRAATDLARLWREIASRNDPRALLALILAAIEGGETTRDVRNARALLEDIV
jgi:hypothetical protein